VTNTLATSVACLRLHRSTVAACFCNLAEIWSHGVLGLLQHYLPKADVEPPSTRFAMFLGVLSTCRPLRSKTNHLAIDRRLAVIRKQLDRVTEAAHQMFADAFEMEIAFY
jgi:hypothetical protein